MVTTHGGGINWLIDGGAQHPVKGPEIKVTFLSAEGLVAGKTQVKYKNVVIGQVSDITLSDDRDHAVATIQLDQAAKAFTAQDSRFWVVRPRIGITRAHYIF